MKRLPKGFGCIHKLSGNRRKLFEALICDKTSGKHKAIRYYATKIEALQALTEHNKNPYDINLSNITVEQLWKEFQKKRFEKISIQGRYVYQVAFKNIMGHASGDITEKFYGFRIIVKCKYDLK